MQRAVLKTWLTLCVVVRLALPLPQVRDNATKTNAKRNKGAGDDGASSSAASVPQRWSDYTVEFHFPEPTELPPPLIQLIDVDFKYPGRWAACVSVCVGGVGSRCRPALACREG